MDTEEKIGKVQYYLRKNYLSTNDDNRYMAAVRRQQPMYQDQIVTLMTRKNTTISREEIELVLKLLKQVVKQQILSGVPVITDLFKSQVTIKGAFGSGEEAFDRGKHSVHVSMVANKKFRKELADEAQIEMVDRTKAMVLIHEIFDWQSGVISNELTAGGLISLKGKCLQPEEGKPEIVLVRVDTDEETPVPEGNIYKATAGDIMLNLPADLEPGEYRLNLLVKVNDFRKEAIEYEEVVTIV